MSIEAMKQALEALENKFLFVAGDGDAIDLRAKAISSLRQAIAEAEKKNNGKLKVTLQDTPTEIELAQYKRMFEAACSALGAVGDALGVDPEEGGAEPIIAAIQELKAEKQEPVGQLQEEVYGRGQVLWFEKPANQAMLYTSPPQRQWVGLTQQDIDIAFDDTQEGGGFDDFARAIEAKLKEKNT